MFLQLFAWFYRFLHVFPVFLQFSHVIRSHSSPTLPMPFVSGSQDLFVPRSSSCIAICSLALSHCLVMYVSKLSILQIRFFLDLKFRCGIAGIAVTWFLTSFCRFQGWDGLHRALAVSSVWILVKRSNEATAILIFRFDNRSDRSDRSGS